MEDSSFHSIPRTSVLRLHNINVAAMIDTAMERKQVPDHSSTAASPGLGTQLASATSSDMCHNILYTAIEVCNEAVVGDEL